MADTGYITSERIENDRRNSLANLEFVGLTGGFGTAVFNTETGELTLSHTRYVDNAGTGMGGAIFNVGKVILSNGAEFSGNSGMLGGGAIFNGESTSLTVNSGAFTSNSASMGNGGAIENWGEAKVKNATLTANVATHGGAIANMDGAVLTITDCTFEGNTASATNDFGGGAISNEGTITITNTEFSGNSGMYGGAIYNLETGNIKLTDVAFKSASDTIVNEGTMTFSGSISLAGNLETLTEIQATNVALSFDISGYESAADIAIVGDFEMLKGVASYSLTVRQKQADGIYVLAKNADAFASAISMNDPTGRSLGTLYESGTVTVDNVAYTLMKNDGVLTVTVRSENVGDQNGLRWRPIPNATVYEVNYSTDDFKNSIVVTAVQTELSSYGIADGTYQWRVRAQDGDDTAWKYCESFEASRGTDAPLELTATDDGVLDVFFAGKQGVWNGQYMASNQGSIGKNGTNELAAIQGKNRIGDLFRGGVDANVLYLSDDDNGDALFIDDIYSDLPENASAGQPRFSHIREIYAGKGDDLVDLTSNTMTALCDGITVHGGEGDDILWGTDGGCWLYGDNGNDRLVGGAGDDVIVGGAGDDSLHGGGGDDTFCFDENWGNDTVAQFADGYVTLWFSSGSLENWDAATGTYTDGDNSVTVLNVASKNITLLFGSQDNPIGRIAE